MFWLLIVWVWLTITVVVPPISLAGPDDAGINPRSLQGSISILARTNLDNSPAYVDVFGTSTSAWPRKVSKH